MWSRGAAAAVAALVFAGATTACGRESSGRTSGAELRVVTTVAPLTSIVASVAGGLASVVGLVPEGTNSHTFEPPPSVARVLSEADVVFVNGLGLEDPIRELAGANLAPGAEIVELGNRAIRPEDYVFDRSFPREGGKPNPHLWTDPPLARRYARIAADVLGHRDPGNSAGYEANYARFATQVDALDAAMRTATATLVPERRKLLTYHDAYAYFARDYGWTVVGAIQVSSFEEPTPRDVGALINQVRGEGVRVVFGSEVFPNPVLEQIGRETGARYVDVLRDDDLPGRPGDPEHSWLGLMRFDFVTMVDSLGGDASTLRSLRLGDTAPDTATYPQ